MRIEAPAHAPVIEAYLWLTIDEAKELRDALNDLIARGGDAAWHAHVSSSDYQTEVSIAFDQTSGVKG